MTKSVIVEDMENSPGVVRIDTEVWKRGPGADREKPAPVPEFIPGHPKYKAPVKD